MKRVGIYLRVSTQDQSCEMQKADLLKFAEARGWHVVDVYEDAGASGTTANRPMLKKLLSDARSRRIDVVACWKLDRFFRSLKDLVVTLQELSEVGVEFISLKDNLDLTTSTGRLMMQIIGAFAEFEAAIIRQRVVAGLSAARSRGKVLGRPRSVDVDKIIELRDAGRTYRDISRIIGVSPGSIANALSQKCI